MSNFLNRNTIYDYLLNEEIPDGIHTMTLGNGTIINFEIINYEEDKTFSSNEVLGNDEADKTMLILNFKKDCTINEGVIVTPQVRKKGFTINVKGTLRNNGKISMTQRGANASGDDILIYEKDIIPAIGGKGAKKVGNLAGVIHGNNGDNGINRGTGGGGSGGYRGNSKNYYAGAGSDGTSYSGGTGGGGNAFNDGANNAQDGSPNGGAGGLSYSRRTSANGWNATGGVGNPAGLDSWKSSGAGAGEHNTTVSENGTGGLLIIFSNILENTGVIEANGSNSGILPNNPTQCATGGASGGGSINIYANIYTVATGIIEAKGGISPEKGVARGGNGGDGCVTIETLSYTENCKKIVQQDKLAYTLVKMAKIIKEQLINQNQIHKQDIEKLTDEISALATETYWGDSVATKENLPTPEKIGETHYVEDISSYAKWNGEKWIFIDISSINKVTETVDGLFKHEDYITFNELKNNSLLSKEPLSIIENFIIKQLYNKADNETIINVYPRTSLEAVIDPDAENEELKTLKAILKDIKDKIGINTYNKNILAIDFSNVTEEPYKEFYKITITHNLNCMEKFRLHIVNSSNENFNMGIFCTNIKENSFDLYSMTKQDLKLTVISES